LKRIIISDEAKTDIRAIPQHIAMNILTAIHRLAESNSGDVKTLKGNAGEKRLRVGDSASASPRNTPRRSVSIPSATAKTPTDKPPSPVGGKRDIPSSSSLKVSPSRRLIKAARGKSSEAQSSFLLKRRTAATTCSLAKDGLDFSQCWATRPWASAVVIGKFVALARKPDGRSV